MELRIVEGGIGKGGRNRGHQKAREVPKYAPLTEHPPDWLAREGKAEWRRLIAEFTRIPNLVQRPDRATLIGWCQEWAKYVEASKDINARGTVLLVESGEALDGRILYLKPTKNPNCIVARDSLAQLIALSSRYGLTPGDRARLNIGKGEPDAHDPLDDILD
jgi:P27 family predicted phage terminase small subunit